MGEGLFILLCILALIIGSRARNSKALSSKSLQTRQKFKKVLSVIAAVGIAFLLVVFIPATYKEIRIAIDTHFTIESYLSIVVLVVGLFTLISIIRIILSSGSKKESKTTP